MVSSRAHAQHRRNWQVRPLPTLTPKMGRGAALGRSGGARASKTMSSTGSSGVGQRLSARTLPGQGYAASRSSAAAVKPAKDPRLNSRVMARAKCSASRGMPSVRDPYRPPRIPISKMPAASTTSAMAGPAPIICGLHRRLRCKSIAASSLPKSSISRRESSSGRLTLLLPHARDRSLVLPHGNIPSRNRRQSFRFFANPLPGSLDVLRPRVCLPDAEPQRQAVVETGMREIKITAAVQTVH